MEHPTGTVVVGLDGSHSSSRALDWAIDQAVAEHRALTLAHAAGRPTSAYVDRAIIDATSVFDVLREEGREILDKARERITARAGDLVVHEVLEFVDPRELLLDLSHGAAVVAVGSHGRGPVASLLVGSVGIALARRAACPVMVHRPHHEGTVRHGILVAADAQPESGPVLEAAYRLADQRRLPLTVLHCYWDVQSLTTGEFDLPSTADLDVEGLDLAEAVAGLGEKYPSVKVTTRLAHGLPGARVAEASERMDLVVVGAHQGSRTKQLLFGSVPVTVVEHAQCPVLVVPVHS